MLSKLVKHVAKETGRIIEHVHAGVDQMRERGDNVQDIDTAEILERLHGLIVAAYGAKHGHKIMSDTLASMGYRPITKDDFAKYGVTGR